MFKHTNRNSNVLHGCDVRPILRLLHDPCDNLTASIALSSDP